MRKDKNKQNIYKKKFVQLYSFNSKDKIRYFKESITPCLVLGIQSNSQIQIETIAN